MNAKLPQPFNSTRVIAEGLFSYQIGGSERVGADLALEFSRRGFSVICFAFYDSDGPIRAELESAGIRCLDFNYERYFRLSRRLTYQMEFWRMLKRENVSALHVHHATSLVLSGIPARLAHVKRTVMTEHGLHQLIERPKYRRQATYYCRYADEISVVDPAQADYFEQHMNVPRSKLHYVPNGVRIRPKTLEKTSRMRGELGIPNDTFAFFYVGRLNPVKDLGTLLTAVSLLPPDVSAGMRLYLVGDGMEREKLMLLQASLGLKEKVFFLGARTDVSDILAAADGFVMSSLTEGLPMALLEAMACGIGCVATAVGAIPQLLSDERGLVVPPQNPQALAAGMASLIRDPRLRTKIAGNALGHVEKYYSLDSIVGRYLELLGMR